jgi:hypothetical protein
MLYVPLVTCEKLGAQLVDNACQSSNLITSIARKIPIAGTTSVWNVWVMELSKLVDQQLRPDDALFAFLGDL